ncbi:MAG: sigma factor-like helix-turn-helix DNA-binding protein, partial [Terriglobales bacterium]
EEMSYEEIAEVTQVSLGTVKSRLTRGRQALKERLTAYAREVGPALGLRDEQPRVAPRSETPVAGRRCEVGS